MKKIIISTFIFLLVTSGSAFAKKAEDGIVMEHSTPGIYIFKMDTKKIGNKIKPYVAEN